MERERVPFRLGQHQGEEALLSVLRDELPGREALALHGAQTVMVSLPHQILDPVEEADLPPDFPALLLRELRRVQFIAEGAGHGDRRSGPEGGGAARLVIGTGRNMGADRRGGIAVGGPLLDAEPGDGVGVVAAPDLRMERQHPRVEAAAAAGAALEQHLRELLRESRKHGIEPQDVAVSQFTLMLRRERCTVEIGHGAVHVPLDIVDGVLAQESCNGLIEPVRDLRPGQIQNHLVPPDGRLPPRNAQGPVRMRPIEIRIFAHHLRLDPEAELQALVLNLADQAAEAVRELAEIRCPVAQGAVVLIAVAEPAVVQNQKLHAELFCAFRQAQQQRLVKGQICRLPAVEQDGAFSPDPRAAAEVAADEAVELPRERAEAVGCEAQKQLRGVKGRSRLQCPAEEAFSDAGDDAERAGLIQFQLGPVVTGIAEHQAAALALVLIGFMITEDDKWIVLVAGIASLRGNRADSVGNGDPLRQPLHGMAAVKVDTVPGAEGQVEAG